MDFTGVLVDWVIINLIAINCWIFFYTLLHIYRQPLKKKPVDINVEIIMPEGVTNDEINEDIELFEDKLNTELDVKERLAVMIILKKLKEIQKERDDKS